MKDQAEIRKYHKAWRDNRSSEQKAEDLLRKRKAMEVARQHNPIKMVLVRKKAECKAAGLKFNLNEEWYLAHFSQGCARTGCELDVEKGSPWHAEIDRIKPGGDYTMDNCRLVCAIYNRARMNYLEDDVKRFARLIIDN